MEDVGGLKIGALPRYLAPYSLILAENFGELEPTKGFRKLLGKGYGLCSRKAWTRDAHDRLNDLPSASICPKPSEP